MQSNPKSHSLLSPFAWLCVAATLALIFLGGMVTSKQAGLAVPDWPLSYGSINPPGWWHIENVRLEHGHRLIGAAIGLLTIALAVWTWRAESRPWLRWLSVAALGGVCVQGLMGGLRVTERSTALAVVHGCIAQAFLAILVVIAVATAPRWRAAVSAVTPAALASIRNAASLLCGVVYSQLILGAIMRHYRAGLAIPDFPLAFGRLIPPLHEFPVMIHFSHRIWAMAVIAAVTLLLITLWRRAAGDLRLLLPGWLILVLTVVQVCLGASVIWLAKAPIPTTFHVVNGALILATSVALATRAFLLTSQPRLDPASVPANRPAPVLAEVHP